MNKHLSNRFVVAGLVMVAIASVLYSTRKELKRAIGPRWASARKPAAVAVKPSVSPAANALPALTAESDPSFHGSQINRELARSRQARWVESPERDPFAIFAGIAVTRPDPQKVMALNVSAIWRQSGQQLAVINGRMVKEGDEAFDYTVERIESGAVFLRNPQTGLARAEFPSFNNLGRTNGLAQARAIAGASRNKRGEPGG